MIDKEVSSQLLTNCKVWIHVEGRADRTQEKKNPTKGKKLWPYSRTQQQVGSLDFHPCPAVIKCPNLSLTGVVLVEV